MKQVLFSFLLFFAGLAYSQVPLTKISISPKSQLKGELMLSDLVESVEYVPLETKENCLTGSISLFDISSNYIIVHCPNTGIIYLFKRDGRFINKIGNVGEGPGEYPRYVSSIFIEEDKKQVIVHVKYPSSRFLKYDLSGKFTGTELMEEKAGTGSFIRLFNNHFFKMFMDNDPSRPYVYEILTRDFKLVKEAVKTVPVERKGGVITISAPPRPYVYNGKVHVRESSLNDTLYVINKDFSFTPKYLIDAGRYKMSVESRSDPEFIRRLYDYVQCNLVFETENFLLLTYFYGEDGKGKGISHYAYYGKNTGKLLYFSSKTGIPNDYDGGIDLWPQRQDDNNFYAFYDAYLFSEQMTAGKKSVPAGPKEAIQSFNRIYQKLDPEDNPILVIVKTKH